MRISTYIYIYMHKKKKRKGKKEILKFIARFRRSVAESAVRNSKNKIRARLKQSLIGKKKR
jgi:hypothetical protein